MAKNESRSQVRRAIQIQREREVESVEETETEREGELLKPSGISQESCDL